MGSSWYQPTPTSTPTAGRVGGGDRDRSCSTEAPTATPSSHHPSAFKQGSTVGVLVFIPKEKEGEEEEREEGGDEEVEDEFTVRFNVSTGAGHALQGHAESIAASLSAPHWAPTRTPILMMPLLMTSFLMTSMLMTSILMTSILMTSILMTPILMTPILMTSILMTSFLMTQY